MPTTPEPVATLRGWCHCRNQSVMHYVTDAGALCGLIRPAPERPFIPAKDTGNTYIKADAAPKCTECDREHVRLWCEQGGPK